MKRLATLSCAAMVLAGATGCRPAVQTTTVPPRASAPEAPGVQACWVETANRFGFTASAIVVRHAEGDLVIDAGNSTHFSEEIEPYHGGTRRWLAVFPGSLKPRRSLSDELSAVDVDPGKLRWVLPTHAHLDHLGGVLDLPPTPVLMTTEEAEIVHQGRHQVGFEVMPAHAEFVAPNIEPLTFDDAPYEIFARHRDLFGDGSVVVVPLPGHTPGSVGVFVRLPDGRRVFHLGDAINDRSQVEHPRGKTAAMRRTDADRGRAEQTVARLHGLAEQADDLFFLPAHERAAWKDVFGEPNRACPRL